MKSDIIYFADLNKLIIIIFIGVRIYIDIINSYLNTH